MMYAGATTSLGNFGIDMIISRGVKQGYACTPCFST